MARRSLLDIFEEIGVPTNRNNTNLQSGPDPYHGCRRSSRLYQARKVRKAQAQRSRSHGFAPKGNGSSSEEEFHLEATSINRGCVTKGLGFDSNSSLFPNEH